MPLVFFRANKKKIALKYTFKEKNRTKKRKMTKGFPHYEKTKPGLL